MSLLNELREVPLIAILRGLTGDEAEQTVAALQAGGIRFVEITLNTDGALYMIEKWREKYGDSLRVGAGTVLDMKDAQAACSAGAEYFVCPHVDDDIIRFAVEHQIGVFPGAMTPTEIVRAHRLGATAVKVFPAGTLGLGYIKELQGPLSHIPMIPTGGATLTNIVEYFRAGAVAVGLGSSLADRSLIAERNFVRIREIAASFVERVKEQLEGDYMV